MKGEFREDFLHGERYRRGPAQVRGFVRRLPLTEVPTKYVVFKPLGQVGDGDDVRSVVFLADADQMSALVVLANYDRSDCDGAVIPRAAGCQSIGILTYQEGETASPRAVVGLNDPSARRAVQRLGKELVTVSVPWALYEKMEGQVEGSFLEKGPWTGLMGEGEEIRNQKSE